MSTVITELGNLCARIPGCRVHLQAADMLVTVPLDGGRQQTVKVWTQQKPADPQPVIRLQSRARIVRGHSAVRQALLANASQARVGFALDTGVNPPALDVVCGLTLDGTELPVADFLDALVQTAATADHVEAAGGAGDQF
jgi:hypothetical protein